MGENGAKCSEFKSPGGGLLYFKAMPKPRVPPPNRPVLSIRLSASLACLGLLSGCVTPWPRPHTAPTPQLQAEADAAYAAGDWSLAVSRLQALARAAPQDAQVRFRLGNALVRADRLEEAIGAYAGSLGIDPAQPKALHNKGIAQLRLARANLRQAAALSSDPEIAGHAAELTRQLDALLEPTAP